MAALALAALVGAGESTASEQRAAAPKSVRLIAPDRIAPVPSDGDLERLPALAPPARPKAKEVHAGADARFRLLPLPIAESAGVLTADGYRVAIAGIGPSDPRELCGTQPEWKCGAAALTAFRAFLRGRSIRCRVPDERPPGGETVVTECTMAGRDVGAWLVGQGWARRSGEAYVEEDRQAQSAARGFFGPPPKSYVPSFSETSASVSGTP